MSAQHVHIDEWMTHGAASVSVDSTLLEVALRMRDTGQRVVVALEQGAMVAGVVTERDLMLASLEQNRPLSAMRTADAMTRPVVGIHRHQTLVEAERAMARHKLRQLVVVDEWNRWVGLISVEDVARYIAGLPSHGEAERACLTALVHARRRGTEDPRA